MFCLQFNYTEKLCTEQYVSLLQDEKLWSASIDKVTVFQDGRLMFVFQGLDGYSNMNT